MEGDNVKHVKQQFGMIMRGDFAAFAETLDESIEMEIHGPPNVRLRGKWRGEPAVVAAVQFNFGQVVDQRTDIHGLVAQGDMVVMFGHERGRYRDDRSPYH